MNIFSRREFGALSAAGTMAVLSKASPTSKPVRQVCAFIKFLQQLSFEELAETIAECGFQGIEATIRPGGLITPENAPRDLPKLVDALAKRDLAITIMTTAVTSSNAKLDCGLLKTAADLGIERYRMGYYKYDLKKPIVPQLDTFRPAIEKLADFNRQIGITAVYQNHAGARNVGSTIWDLHDLLNDIDPEHIGIAFDIRHAVASSGESWPILWNLAKPHSRAIYVKDFVWQDGRIKNVPLGQGMVPSKFIKSFTANDQTTPISLHVEYLAQAGLKENTTALASDLAVLQGWTSDG